jgi:acetyltransferase-like isoleucine patch superfamily enzyme
MNILQRKQNIFLLSELLKRIYYKIYLKRRVNLGKKIRVIGKPIIINKGSIKIRNNTQLISSSKFYGEGIFPVSLYTINKNAKIEIGNNCTLQGTSIRCYNNIKIGNNVVFAANTKIVDHDHNIDPKKRNLQPFPSKPIEIKDNVWIGYNVMILRGISIGKNSVIGAGSVVTKSIPDNVVAAGTPAKVIKKYNSPLMHNI